MITIKRNFSKGGDQMSITIEEILLLPIFGDAKLISGEKGTHKEVRWVTILEVLDEITQLQSGELLITTAFDLLSNEDLIDNLIRNLQERNLSGIIIQTGYYLEAIPERMIQESNKYHFPIIELPRTTTFSEITKIVHRNIMYNQFEKIKFSEELYKKLAGIAVSDNGLRPFTHLLSQLVKGDIAIFDKDLNELCYNVDSSLNFHNENLIKYLYPFKEDFESGSFLTKTIKDEEQHILISSVKSNNIFYGYIIALKSSKFDEFEEIAIQHTSTIAAVEFIKLSSLEKKDNQYKADFLELLLTGNYTDDLSIYSKGEVLGYKIGTYDTCVAIIKIDNYDKMLNLDKIESDLLHTILKKLDENGLQTMFKLFSGQFVLLISNRFTNRVNITKTLEKIADYIFEKFDVSLSVGIGNYYKDFKKYRDSYKEAQEALFIIESVWKEKKSLHINNLGLYQLLLPLFQDRNLIRDYHQKVLGNILGDEELIETLKVYLENTKLNEAADKLFIHRHTLKYRIKKIEKLTNRDINNFNDRVELEIALIIHNVFKAS